MVNMKKIFQYIIDNIKIFLSITGAVSVIGGTAWGIAFLILNLKFDFKNNILP